MLLFISLLFCCCCCCCQKKHGGCGRNHESGGGGRLAAVLPHNGAAKVRPGPEARAWVEAKDDRCSESSSAENRGRQQNILQSCLFSCNNTFLVWAVEPCSVTFIGTIVCYQAHDDGAVFDSPSGNYARLRAQNEATKKQQAQREANDRALAMQLQKEEQGSSTSNMPKRRMRRGKRNGQFPTCFKFEDGCDAAVVWAQSNLIHSGASTGILQAGDEEEDNDTDASKKHSEENDRILALQMWQKEEQHIKKAPIYFLEIGYPKVYGSNRVDGEL